MRDAGNIFLKVLLIIGLCGVAFLVTSGFKIRNDRQAGAEEKGRTVEQSITLAPMESESTAVAKAKTIDQQPAAGTKSSPIEGVKETIEAFIGAETWEDALPYIYRADDLKGEIADYYQDRPFKSESEVAMQFFQMELDPELGGPYWVYLVSADPDKHGIPVIVREEEGEKKVDWEIYSEFHDKHFAQLLNGEAINKSTFRVVAERIESLDRLGKEAMGTMDDYLIYQLKAPYGEFNEFLTYAFVPRETETARRMDEVMGVADEPLATVLTLGKKKVGDNVFYVVEDYVNEGWFSKE